MTDPEATTDPAPVSTAPETTALSRGKKSEGKKGDRSHPWRDNIEAIAISIVTIVLFKYFVLEAYKIPTGSMQPTLMGNEETGIYDRVLVDKLSYHFRDPERFEIVVFKYPLDSAKNFIKRIVGMPGERLFLKGGDPWIQPEGESEARVLRRPRPIQDAQLRRLETAGRWRTFRGASGWTIDSASAGDTIVATGGGEATFPPPPDSIRDHYLDGYPEGMKSKVKVKSTGYNDVTDLRVRAGVEAGEGTREVAFVLQEGPRDLRFVLPGPAAPASERARIEVVGVEPSELPGGSATVIADGDHRLRAGRTTEVEVQNLNDLLALRIGGEEVATLEIPPAPDDVRSSVTVSVDAAAAATTRVDGLRIWRDIYYTAEPGKQKVTSWDIPPGHYVVLGDNSQDSSDGRDWTLARFRVGEGADAEIVRGNLRQAPSRRPGDPPPLDANPRMVAGLDGGPGRIFLRDELGERHVFEADEVQRLDDQTASLVPRELVRGRAVLVVWPLAPQHDVYRWKWVR